MTLLEITVRSCITVIVAGGIVWIVAADAETQLARDISAGAIMLAILVLIFTGIWTVGGKP